jgi:hypothetical protein
MRKCSGQSKALLDVSRYRSLDDIAVVSEAVAQCGYGRSLRKAVCHVTATNWPVSGDNRSAIRAGSHFFGGRQASLNRILLGCLVSQLSEVT